MNIPKRFARKRAETVLRLGFVIFFAISCNRPIVAAPEDWSASISEANEENDAMHLKLAEERFKTAIRLAESDPLGVDKVATSVSALAHLQMEQSDFEGASKTIDSGLQWISNRADNYEARGRLEFIKGALYARRNKLIDAERQFQLALQLQQSQLDMRLFDTLRSLAILYEEENKLDAAESYCKRAIEIATADVGATTQAAADAQLLLCRIVTKLRRYDEAKALLGSARAIYICLPPSRQQADRLIVCDKYADWINKSKDTSNVKLPQLEPATAVRANPGDN